MQSTHILLVEDDHRLADMVMQYLAQSAYQFTHVDSGERALEQFPYIKPDLVLLDIMLPGIDGLEVCKRIRTMTGISGRTPILMLTAKGDPMDRVVGLELGADDYLPKPFEPRELLARIRALLRRGQRVTEDAESYLRFGSLEINKDSREVILRGKPCEMTTHQFDILLSLAERAGRVVSRDQIMEAVRGRELEAFDRSIDVHMGRIRAAIEDDAKCPQRIITVRGVGYMFAKQQD